METQPAASGDGGRSVTTGTQQQSPMTKSPKPYDHAWLYLRDVAIAFIAIVVGFGIAGGIAQLFGRWSLFAYAPALCIGLLPFWWFTRRCGLHDCPLYDYAGNSACVAVMAVAMMALIPLTENAYLFLFIILFSGPLGNAAWMLVRQCLPPSVSSKDDAGVE